MPTAFLAKNKISRRLITIICILFLGMAGLIGMQLRNYRNGMIEEREQKTRSLVENVNSLILFYYVKVARDGLPEAEAKDYAIQAIRQLHYDENEYFWIMDKTARIIMHAARPELEGQHLIDTKDSSGKYLFQEMLNGVKEHGAAFVRYNWTKPGHDKNITFAKLSYVKGFDPWGWVIGSGIYIDDVDDAFWNAVYISTSLALALLLFVMALALTVSEGVKKNNPPS